jgi:hypothetical protein
LVDSNGIEVVTDEFTSVPSGEGSLKIAFDADTKQLYSSYTTGDDYTVLTNYPAASWGMSDSSVFNIGVYAGADSFSVTGQRAEEGVLEWDVEIPLGFSTSWNPAHDGDWTVTFGFCDGAYQSTIIPFTKEDGTTPLPNRILSSPAPMMPTVKFWTTTGKLNSSAVPMPWTAEPTTASNPSPPTCSTRRIAIPIPYTRTKVAVSTISMCSGLHNPGKYKIKKGPPFGSP